MSIHKVQAESLVDLDTQNHNAALPPAPKTTEPKFPNTSTLSNNLVQVSQDIQENTEAIRAADKSQNELQVDIQNLEKDIQVVKVRLEKRTTILKERALAYQQSDKQLTYIEVLLEASSLNDFLDRVGAVAAFAEADQVLIEQQKSEQQEYARKQANLNKKLTSLAELTDNLKIRRTQLEKKQAEFKQMALQLEASPSHIVNPINAQNGYVHTVINAGRKYIGDSVYVFGGGRTASDIAQGRFDCSGFVHWAFSQAGIEIGRDTSSIKNDGRQVSAANMQPGDLVFFDTYKKDGHVGIYIGDGKFIGSQSSTGVAIADMTKGYWKSVFNGQVIRI
ncbi:MULTISPECIES: NlpC/P60 family protein [unclassified Bacillus (in: firmicutes)]|uniref:C40 family peptidase n=1 Tax=unclassified Bacillus (in: firmicutes) TaxID=185979 RepID=UPI0020D2695B|nr:MULTISPECIES: C40 family peptidase [unclassified Bacillus (in: firmicutes)]